MDIREECRQLIEEVKGLLTGSWVEDANLMARAIDVLEGHGADPARHELRRMVIRAMEHQTLRLALGYDERDYFEYVADCGTLPVTRDAFGHFVENFVLALKEDADAAFALAVGYQNGEFGKIDRRFVLIWYTIAAEKGHVQAQYNLAVCYQNGDGIKPNHKSALKWFKMAADNGYVKAAASLGLYRSGVMDSEKSKPGARELKLFRREEGTGEKH